MAITVLIPTPLRPFVGGKDALELEGENVGEVLDQLTSDHAELRKHLFADVSRVSNNSTCTFGLRSWTRRRADSSFGMPTVSVPCRI